MRYSTFSGFFHNSLSRHIIRIKLFVLRKISSNRRFNPIKYSVPQDLENLPKHHPLPIVSVIIPFYQAETYLQESIDSALQSKYVSVELILVNDGSTDRSFEIAKKAASLYPNIKLLNLENNQGVYFARNCGLLISTGEYIAFWIMMIYSQNID